MGESSYSDISVGNREKIKIARASADKRRISGMVID